MVFRFFTLLVLCCLLGCTDSGGVSNSPSGVISSSSFNASSIFVSSWSSSSSSFSSEFSSASSDSSRSATSEEVLVQAASHVGVVERLVGLFNGIENKGVDDLIKTFNISDQTRLEDKLNALKNSVLLGDAFDPIKASVEKALIGVAASFLDQISKGILDQPEGVNVITEVLGDDFNSEYVFSIFDTVTIEGCAVTENCDVVVEMRVRMKILDGGPGGSIPSGEFNVSVPYPMEIFLEEFSFSNNALTVSVEMPAETPAVTSNLWAVTGGYEGEIENLSLEKLDRIEFRANGLNVSVPMSITSKLNRQNSIQVQLSAQVNVVFESTLSSNETEEDGETFSDFELEFQAPILQSTGSLSGNGSLDGESLSFSGKLDSLNCEGGEVCLGQVTRRRCDSEQCDNDWRLKFLPFDGMDYWKTSGQATFLAVFNSESLLHQFNFDRSTQGVTSIFNGLQRSSDGEHNFDLKVTKKNALQDLVVDTQSGFRTSIGKSGQEVRGEIFSDSSLEVGKYLDTTEGIDVQYADGSKRSFWRDAN